MKPASLNELLSGSLYIDAHCHGCDYPSPPSLFDDMEREKILFLSSATDPDSIRRAAELNRACPRFLHGAGIHPWNAGQYGPADLEELLPFYRRAPQISEIGMDAVWAPPGADGKKQEIPSGPSWNWPAGWKNLSPFTQKGWSEGFWNCWTAPCRPRH
jgi:hypothetical protein